MKTQKESEGIKPIVLHCVCGEGNLEIRAQDKKEEESVRHHLGLTATYIDVIAGKSGVLIEGMLFDWHRIGSINCTMSLLNETS